MAEPISGHVADGFGLVADAFAANFDDPGEDAAAGPDIRFGLGYELASPSMPGFGPASYGHTGAGGRLGIADPDHGVGIGYICSRMRDIGPGGDPRWLRLIDAVISCAR